MNQEPKLGPNPYVGPRAFKEGEELFGRPQELLRLLHLIIAERVVLLYSPSGAGKTSLIQAALIPGLKNKKFRVLGPMSVGRELSREKHPSLPGNRYLSSLLLSLDQQPPEEELIHPDLGAYIEQRAQESGGPVEEVLIFDQFEEILTLDPTDTKDKKAFFAQVGEVLEARHRWALFAMREEYLAGLEPYARLIPTRFRNSFRLELLGVEAARQAIQKPAARAGVDFTNDAAQKLLQDLCKVWLQQPDGSFQKQDGPNVEPVQLQVVCQRLWEKYQPRWAKLPPKEWKIEEKDIEEYGDVNTALAQYYADKLAAVAQETGVRERHLREWFDRSLITAQGIRGQVLQGQDQGLELEVIRALVDAHLVREDKRRGATWFELAHDRLIDPVRSSNTAWFRANLSTLQVQADAWERQNHPDTMLFRGQALREAEQWAQAHPEPLTPPEQWFLQKCQKARRQARLIRGLGFFLGLLVLFLCYLGYSGWQKKQPWGYVRNFSTGTLHYLKGDTVSIGRSTEDFHNQIDLRPRAISRIHFFITRDLTGLDMRSLNGTTVNAKFLPYGYSRKLRDGDILVLAGLAPFQITTAGVSLPAIGRPLRQSFPPPPAGAWGMLVDGNSRAITYLSQSLYFLSLDERKNLVISEHDTQKTLITIEKYINQIKDKLVAMIRIKKGNSGGYVKYTYKESDYSYPKKGTVELNLPLYYAEPITGNFDTIGACTFWYSEIPDDEPVEVIHFQIVPIIEGLEPQKPTP